jgi:plasmid segregation protein ParM
MMKKTISIDHGNRLIKSSRYAFPSSFLEGNHIPPISDDVLKYEGKTYTLVDQILPVQNDKTEDERYYILSLFAIGKELASEAELMNKLMNKLTPNDHIKVELLIGLPLQHYEVYKDKFRRYFTDRKDIICYELNGRKYSIKIVDAHVFPQAFSAAITICNQLADSRIVNIIDVGGVRPDRA